MPSVHCWVKNAPEASWPRGRIQSAGISCQPESGALTPLTRVWLEALSSICHRSLSQCPTTASLPQNHVIAEGGHRLWSLSLPLALSSCSVPSPLIPPSHSDHRGSAWDWSAAGSLEDHWLFWALTGATSKEPSWASTTPPCLPQS